jgi:hypothetical protein
MNNNKKEPVYDNFSDDENENLDLILKKLNKNMEKQDEMQKMFFDLKSPNGLLFIAKQNVLSNAAVRTQTSGVVNEGIYSPLNTLAEAGVVAFGYHLNKQGINPFEETGAYANNDALYNSKVKSTQPLAENRLVLLYSGSFIENKSYDINGLKLNDGQNVMVYTGGPGSILGIGTDYKLYTKVNLSAPWVGIGDNSCCVIDITQTQDGTIIGVGRDNKLYSKKNITDNWIAVGDNSCCVKRIINTCSPCIDVESMWILVKTYNEPAMKS